MNEIKGIVSGNEVDISKVAMIVNGVDKGWEVRRQNGDILWGADRTLIGTDTIQTKGYGLPLKSVHIEGNTQQTGTPAPDNIIMPEFVGVRTGNLFDVSTAVFGKYIDSSGVEQTSSTGQTNHSDYIVVTPNTSYTLAATKPVYTNITSAISWYDTNKAFISRSSRAAPSNAGRFSWTAQSPSNAAFAIINFQRYPSYGNEKDMLNTGSAALPYEPYGYKIPITCAGQTVPIYLGGVPTVRRIKKLVLTGNESQWYYRRGDPPDIWFISKSDLGIDWIPYVGICDRAVCGVSSFSGLQEGEFILSTGNLGLRLPPYTSDNNAWLTYLAEQYAAGTPVTVWYVLAEPQTGIVNEPLAKIGDYADELHIGSEVTIPTAIGTNILTVDTSLAPSRTEITGHVKSGSS